VTETPATGPDPAPASTGSATAQPSESAKPAEAGSAEAGQTELGEPGKPARSRARLTGTVIIQAITQGSSAVITILAIFLALVVGAFLIAFSDPVVTKAWSTFFSYPLYAIEQTWDSVSFAYSQMFEGAILNPSTVSAAFHGGSIAAIFYPLSSTCAQATPLILTGLSVAIAFRAGLFNIGAAGQWVGGAIVATWLGFGVSLPPGIHVIVCIIGAFVGGAVIGWFVGLLKAKTGAHEVIVTIMLNYVMYDLLSWLLSRTTTGFEFRTVGASPSAARTAGINVERSWILVMLLAGGLAGLSATTVIQGTNTQLTFNSYGTYGPDGITVALLGRARPIGVVLAGLLFGALHVGGTYVEAATLGQVPADIVQVLEGLIVLFVAAPALIRAVFRLRSTAGTGLEAVAKGWNG
jgi:general nucleoside transport system permease protein